MAIKLDEPVEIDRAPPIGMLNFAQAYLAAARHLQQEHEDRKVRLLFDDPIYFLYSHALELTMKAFLRAQGVSARELASPKFGHKLKTLWNACLSRRSRNQ